MVYIMEFSNVSDMNMAVLTLGRIHESLYNCNQHQRERNYKEWFYEMMVLIGEASASMKGTPDNILKPVDEIKQDEKLKKDNFAQAKILITELEPLINKTGTSQVTYQELYMKLFYLGIFIKQILKEGGVLMRLKEDARYAI